MLNKEGVPVYSIVQENNGLIIDSSRCNKKGKLTEEYMSLLSLE